MEVSQGRLHYSPKLLGDSKSDKWWLIVECDTVIGEYARHLYWLSTHRTMCLSRPAWREHITVVRDEEPANKEHWEEHEGVIVEFQYSLSPQTNGEYWWLEVECPALLDMREQLGLPREPFFPLHLSIGHNNAT